MKKKDHTHASDEVEKVEHIPEEKSQQNFLFEMAIEQLRYRRRADAKSAYGATARALKGKIERREQWLSDMLDDIELRLNEAMSDENKAHLSQGTQDRYKALLISVKQFKNSANLPEPSRLDPQGQIPDFLEILALSPSIDTYLKNMDDNDVEENDV